MRDRNLTILIKYTNASGTHVGQMSPCLMYMYIHACMYYMYVRVHVEGNSSVCFFKYCLYMLDVHVYWLDGLT